MSCANSIGTTNYSTDDHNLDNYLKLKALENQLSSLLKTIEEGAFKLISQNLRNNKVESREWANEELRKVNEIFGIFGEEYTFKTN